MYLQFFFFFSTRFFFKIFQIIVFQDIVVVEVNPLCITQRGTGQRWFRRAVATTTHRVVEIHSYEAWSKFPADIFQAHPAVFLCSLEILHTTVLSRRMCVDLFGFFGIDSKNECGYGERRKFPELSEMHNLPKLSLKVLTEWRRPSCHPYDGIFFFAGMHMIYTRLVYLHIFSNLPEMCATTAVGGLFENVREQY